MNPYYRTAVRGAAAGIALALGVSAAAAESRFSEPTSGDVLASGVAHQARWDSPCGAHADADEMELLLSVDGGRTFPIRLSSDMPRCSSTFRWKVPAVSAGSARLAVRVGREGQAETERIAFVSDEFRITSFETSPTSSLVRGPSEWWTEQALLEIGAEGLLGGALRGIQERLGAPAAESDLDEPPTGLGELAIDSLETQNPSGGAVPGIAAHRAPSRRAAPLPLRE